MSTQFEPGFQPQPQSMDPPGLQAELKNSPLSSHVPTPDGGMELYRAAGKLTGRKAVVTGGDSGIGRSAAVLFAMEGAEVYIAYLAEEEKDAQETKRQVEEAGQKCHLHSTDLKQAKNCKAVIDQALQAMGAVNILFNNHAYQMQRSNIEELSEEQWLYTFDTNIHPFFYLSKYVIPHMKRGDTIINNGSINAYVGRPDLLDYTSTKGAIVAFTRALSNQYVAKGIRVNAVCPGPVYTPLIPSTMSKETQEQFTSPMGRPSQPSEIATVCVFLASTDSSSISGQSIHANGGTIVNG